MNQSDLISVARELTESFLYKDEFDDFVLPELATLRPGVQTAALAVEVYRLIESIEPGRGREFAASLFKRV